LADDLNRLGNRYATKAARIEAVDLTARRGLGNGACEGLAGRGAAARISVVTDAGNPRTCRLRVRRQGKQGK